jgi:hypothetical protein
VRLTVWQAQTDFDGPDYDGPDYDGPDFDGPDFDMAPAQCNYKFSAICNHSVLVTWCSNQVYRNNVRY